MSTTAEHVTGVDRTPPPSANGAGDVLFPLQRASRRNLRRHWWRDAWRVSVLLLVDVGTFGFLKVAAGWTRDGRLGQWLAQLATDVFTQGFLGGWKFAVALVLSMFISGAYGPGEYRRDTGRVVAGAALAALISLYPAVWEYSFPIVVLQFVATVAIVGSAVAVTRLGVDQVVVRVRGGFAGTARTLLVAHQSANWARIREIMAPGSEMRIAAELHLADRPDEGIDLELTSLRSIIHLNGIDTVLLWTDLNEDEFAYAVDVALASGCRLLTGPRAPGALPTQPKAVWVDGHPLIELTTPSLQAWQFAAKRAFDFTGALLGLIVLSPVFAAVAIAVRFNSAGPVFFRQNRVGRAGREFRIFKFRSMVVGAEEQVDRLRDQSLYDDQRLFKVENDPRVTRIGGFLRRSSIDELPQLINVLLGDMSLVGPRPPLPTEVALYGERDLHRFTMKPGMTGPWQVSGRNRVRAFDQVIRMELDYIRRWSFSRDLLILLKTIPAVLRMDGAH